MGVIAEVATDFRFRIATLVHEEFLKVFDELARTAEFQISIKERQISSNLKPFFTCRNGVKLPLGCRVDRSALCQPIFCLELFEGFFRDRTEITGD